MRASVSATHLSGCGARSGAIFVALIGVGNALGRFATGVLSDSFAEVFSRTRMLVVRVRRAHTLLSLAVSNVTCLARAQILCAWQALASIGIAFLPYAGLYVMAPAIGAGFGATYALAPPAIADAFGERARSATVR